MALSDDTTMEQAPLWHPTGSGSTAIPEAIPFGSSDLRAHLHDGLPDPSAAHKDDLVYPTRYERIPSFRIAMHDLDQIWRRTCTGVIAFSHESS